MPFGLANAPAVFQAWINSVFRDMINNYVLIYLDDIVIFSNSREEHDIHIKQVLERLKDNRLLCKPQKCHFYQSSITLLGYCVDSKGVSMDINKVQAILDWPIPQNIKQVQQFLGFINFYRSFISDFSSKCVALTRLLKKTSSFKWDSSEQKAFDVLKNSFINASVLSHANLSLPFIVECDASDFALGGVLYQKDAFGKLLPLQFFSRQLLPAERNYEIYDKELLAIISCFKHWRHFLMGSLHPVTVFCDHKNLQYFMSTKQLTRRQARWSLFLSEFDFVVTYRSGKSNIPADCLSRRPDFEVPSDPHNLQRILHPTQIAIISSPVEDSSSIENSGSALVSSPSSSSDNSLLLYSNSLRYKVHVVHDWPLLIADFLQSPNNSWLSGIPSDILSKCRKFLNQFEFRNSVFGHIDSDGISFTGYVPYSNRDDIIRRYHETLAHLKFDSIFPHISRHHWWPSMKQDIKSFIRRCPHCQLNRSSSGSHSNTPLRPILPAALPFDRWGLDFIQNLPHTSHGNRHIITAIDYATRWIVTKAVPVMDEISVITFLYENILMSYGCPLEIVTDRGKSFLSSAVESFITQHQIFHVKSTPYHPQTNGVIERMHAMIGHGISTLTNSTPNRWDEVLFQVTFAIRCRTHSVTGFSPFYLLYGCHPRLLIDPAAPDCIHSPLDSPEFQARLFEDLGQARVAANIRSNRQAQILKEKHQLDPDAPDYFFKVNDWVKLKHFGATKFEFKWKGPYQIVDVGFPGTYWLMDPRGRRLDSTVNESHLAPWLSTLSDNQEYFYDGRSVSTSASRGDSVISVPDFRDSEE
jgi:hypothetical protein